MYFYADLYTLLIQKLMKSLYNLTLANPAKDLGRFTPCGGSLKIEFVLKCSQFSLINKYLSTHFPTCLWTPVPLSNRIL